MFDLKMLVKYGITNLEEYRFLIDDSRLGENIHLLVFGGSRAYGTNTPESDVDIRGIATNTASSILLGRDFETVVDTNTDTVIYSLDRIFELLTNCNPNTIEILNVREQDIIYADEIGKQLLEHKNIFLSQRCAQSFGGYATSQLYRLRQKTLDEFTEEELNIHIAKVINGMREHLFREYGEDLLEMKVENGMLVASIRETSLPAESFANILNEVNNVIREYTKRSSRNDMAIKYGKINKHAMHLVRLYIMGTELMETGTTCTYREKEHDLIMAIRNGEYMEAGIMNQKFYEMVERLESRFMEAKDNTVLPEAVDQKKLDELREKINRYVVINVQGE